MAGPAGEPPRHRVGRTRPLRGDQRADIARLTVSLRRDLTAKGLEFNDVDTAAFRAALGKTSFYRDWKAKFGDEAWAILEKTTGSLV